MLIDQNYCPCKNYHKEFVWEKEEIIDYLWFVHSSANFQQALTNCRSATEYKNFIFTQNFIADSKVASHLYRFTVYVTGNLFCFGRGWSWKSFAISADTLRTLTNAGMPSGFMRERETSRGKFRIFEEEKMVLGNLRRWELTSIRDLARTANWFVIQVAWRFARRSGSTLFIPYPWARRVKQTGRRRRERSGTRLGDTGEDVAACGCKKERDVSLTRDFPRTINCGGAEIIRDFVAVTCDANKSLVPITYALKTGVNLKARVSSTAWEWKTRK